MIETSLDVLQGCNPIHYTFSRFRELLIDSEIVIGALSRATPEVPAAVCLCFPLSFAAAAAVAVAQETHGSWRGSEVSQRVSPPSRWATPLYQLMLMRKTELCG